MAYTIDAASYRKDTILGPGQGWDGVRPTRPTTIVIHTTNNPEPTTFDFEAKYLRKSLDVSTHYLVGKLGQIVQFLSPDLIAWHAGAALAAYINDHSIGIEAHVSVGESWTDAQHAAHTWLTRKLMADYGIIAEHIDTHRKVAIPGPNIRKHDPEGWDDAAFYAWRAALATRVYTVRGLPVYQRPDLTGAVAGHLDSGARVVIDVTYPNGAGHLQTGLGFVDLDGLEG